VTAFSDNTTLVGKKRYVYYSVVWWYNGTFDCISHAQWTPLINSLASIKWKLSATTCTASVNSAVSICTADERYCKQCGQVHCLSCCNTFSSVKKIKSTIYYRDFQIYLLQSYFC